MASTYVNDLRLNEMATGDESGNWGNVTNTNLELIGDALGYGTEAITTNADTHTSTIADGAADPVRAMYVKYTGTLDSACTITIAPNTINRMQFIENATSGSQNIIISQGSGANVTIPAGDVKAVYLDGAGSGAAVVDAFASLSTVDLKVQDDLTVTDDASIGGNLTLTGNGDFNGDLDVDGTTNLDVVDIDGAVDMATTLTLGGNADFNGDLDVDGTTNLDVVDIDGAVDMASTLQVDGSITTSDGMTITTADNDPQLQLISTDADANIAPLLQLYRNSSSPADNDQVGRIEIYGENDADEKILYSEIVTQIKDASDGTEDGRMAFNTMTAGTAIARIDILPAETVVNEGSYDLDFRVESNDTSHQLFVDGGNNRVGINLPSSALVPPFPFVAWDDDETCILGHGNNAAYVQRYQDTATGPATIVFDKARGTQGSPTTSNNGDDIARMLFRGYTSNGYYECASIHAEVDSSGIGSTTDIPGSLYFKTTPDGGTPTERKRIASNGAIYTQPLSTAGFLMAEITNSHLGNDSSGTGDITFTVTFTNTSGVYDAFQVMLYLNHTGNSSPIESAQVLLDGYQRSTSVLGINTTTVVGDARPISTSTSGLALTITVQSEGSSVATQGAYVRAIGGYYGIASIAAGNSA